jgi:hypothetical protein
LWFGLWRLCFSETFSKKLSLYMPSILKNHRYILFHSLATHHLIHLVYATTGIAIFAVRRRRTAKGRKRTAPPLPCAFSQSARQRAPGSFLPGKELCRALWEKATHSTVRCRA